MRKTALSVALACTLAAGLGACAQQPQQQQPQQGEQQGQQQSQPAQGQAQDAQAATSREGFSVREISDDLFARMRSGRTYKDDCVVPREDLRYLTVLHKDKAGNTHQG